MKRSSKELKALAREALMGNYGNFAVIYLVYFIIAFAVEGIPAFFSNTASTSGYIIFQIVTIILSLIISILAVGLQKAAINITRKEPIRIGDLFYAFKHNPDKYIIASFLMALIAVAFQIPTIVLAILSSTGTFVLSISESLFIFILIMIMTILSIISIIVLLRYALTLIVLMEDSELGAIEAMRTSARLMQGNKWRYFCLTFSFIGYHLLALFTCGLGYFWVTPYMTTTLIEFYRELTGELDNTLYEEL